MRNRVYVLKKFRATSPGNLAHLMDRLGPSDLFGNSKSSVTVRSCYRVFSFMMDHGNFGSMLIDCITYRLGVRSLIFQGQKRYYSETKVVDKRVLIRNLGISGALT